MIVADVRRSQLVTTFGIGGMYPAQDQSLMICGLDEWRENACRPITEPRLARSLGVRQLKEPPAGLDAGDVPSIRFPRFYFCPECRRLDDIDSFDATGRQPRCQRCSCVIVPSRFVACCADGHIDDFPYSRWVHRGAPAEGNHALKLRTRGETSALRDIDIICSCGATRSMDGAFSPGALRGIAICLGRRPWLGDSDPQGCRQRLRTLQRGSASVWFGNVRSSISIPPWSQVQDKLDQALELLRNVPDAALMSVFSSADWIPEGSGLTPERLMTMFTALRDAPGAVTIPTEASMRAEEHQALLDGHVEMAPTDQFVCTRVSVSDDGLGSVVSEVRNVGRLREVRALVGFDRVQPSGASQSPLSREQVDWLPAIEVFGEGLFLELAPDWIDEWSTRPFATLRSAGIRDAASALPAPVDASPRHLLVHSFAHALMNELSLDAGYPVASLRERLYVGPEQAGVMVYTATSDAAGSLGGLSRQSQPTKLDRIIRSAMARAQWCSSDPICIESRGSGTDNLNLAACHACLLVPETSCELRNTLLDRALLVGTPDDSSAGFFSGLLQ